MTYNPNNPNGQATMASSAPVVVASNQSAVPISAASLPLPTGAAADATLTGGTQQTKLTDGTNIATVKAASTAAVAADKAVVVAVSPNNTVAATQSGTWTVQPGNTANTTPWLIRHAGSTTSSGLSVAKILAAASVNNTNVKASAGAVYGWHFVNNATSTRYVRFFNLATTATMGTSSPLFVIPLPASGGAVMAPGLMNLAFSTGITYAITGAAADLDNTAVAANDVVGTFFYV